MHRKTDETRLVKNERRPRRLARIWISLRRGYRRILKQKGTPESVALGLAIGVFVAFTPTVGLQMILAALAATLLGASRTAAVIPVWITNPFTIPPVFAFTYAIGKGILGGPPVSEVTNSLSGAVQSMERFSWYEIHELFTTFFRIGTEAFLDMLLGGAIVGAVCAGITYPITVRTIRRFRALRARIRSRLDHKREGGDAPPGGPGDANPGPNSTPGRYPPEADAPSRKP